MTLKSAELPILGVIVGHTKKQPGASGVPPIDECEYFWNLDLALRIKQAGKTAGVDVRVRLRDVGGVVGAYQQIETVNPKAVVELHFNAANGQARGTETLYARDISKAWAERLQEGMVALYRRWGTSNRGVKRLKSGERGLQSVSQLEDIPSALIEPFFGDNPEDAKLGQDNKNQLALVIIEAFLRLG